MVRLTVMSDPHPSKPDRHKLLPCGRKVGTAKTRYHAQCWREGWEARLDLRSRRSGPAQHHTGHSHWARGWDAANVYAAGRARRTPLAQAAD